jgi:hypothetical protein
MGNENRKPVENEPYLKILSVEKFHCKGFYFQKADIYNKYFQLIVLVS